VNIMVPEPISTAYFINPSHQSVCLYVYYPLSLLGKASVKYIPPFIARQRLGKHVPTATNTRKNRGIAGRVSLWVCLCISLSLLGNNSVQKFPQQRSIVGGVVLYAVLVVLEERRRSLLPRTSCKPTFLILKK
jgi:hypothetical protein